MTREEAAFLERVCAEPDDDAPRLIFADWLDERNDPRGEFIRVQIAIARLAADDLRRPELLDREATLLARYHARWSNPLRGVAGWTEFRRGFVETALVEGRTFLRRAGELFRLAPVRHIWFLDVGSSLEPLMNSPYLDQLSAVTISAQHIDERLTRALVESPHLSGVRQLNIGRNRVGDRGAERLAWSAQFRNLTELNLSDNAIGDTGVRAITASSNLCNLESLELRRNELSRASLISLCTSTSLSRLRNLGVALNYIGTPQEYTLPPAGAVGLKSLNLSENGLTAEAMSLLTRLPGLGGLSRLVLDRNEIGNDGAATLAKWSGAASLQSLHLVGNRISDEGARCLARSPYFHQLVELEMSENPLRDSGAFEFLNSPSLRRLRQLGLPHLGLSPRMRRALAARFAG